MNSNAANANNEVIEPENYFCVLIHFSAYIITVIFKTKNYNSICPLPITFKNNAKNIFEED